MCFMALLMSLWSSIGKALHIPSPTFEVLNQRMHFNAW